MTAVTVPSTAFDAYAEQYEQALNNGLKLSGEGPEYFAKSRIAWSQQVLSNQGQLNHVLDFGCGIGLAVPLIRELLQPKFICGFDPSSAAIERAREELGNASTQFVESADRVAVDTFDLAYCNGVFHHIDPVARPSALQTVYRALKPGGCFALWENNPWNPGTRYVMSRIPFDRDAITLSPPVCRRMLRTAGFNVIRTDAWFLFPSKLSWFRPLEKWVHRLPLGAQYLVLAQKPVDERLPRATQ